MFVAFPDYYDRFIAASYLYDETNTRLVTINDYYFSFIYKQTLFSLRLVATPLT